jgi:hypothetical protein
MMRTAKLIGWSLFFFALSACVERVEIDIELGGDLLVVEGSITDAPPPYQVKLTRASQVESDSTRINETGATIMLMDDVGNSETFTEKEPGVYQSGLSMQGVVGRSYSIKIITADGATYESTPDKMNAVGSISEIRYEFEARTVVEEYGEVAANVLNIYVDSEAGDGDEKFVRWRYTGTYEVLTWPALHFTWTPPYTPYKDPWPCSGFILIPGPPGSGGLLLQVGDCECCNCWITLPEDKPQLSDTQLISGNVLNNVKVGEVPVNNASFHKKFRVEVEQMSMSRTAYEFFKLIREQKENASSIFQPPSGEIRGNIRPVNSTKPVVGLFWATAVKKKTIFIYPEDLPINLTPIDYITLPCNDFYKGSTSVKPAGWD